MEHHGGHDAVLNTNPNVVSLEVEFIERRTVLANKVSGTDERAVGLVVCVENSEQVRLCLGRVGNRFEVEQAEVGVCKHRIGEHIVAVVRNLCFPALGEGFLALSRNPSLLEAAEFVLGEVFAVRAFACAEPFVNGLHASVRIFREFQGNLHGFAEFGVLFDVQVLQFHRSDEEAEVAFVFIPERFGEFLVGSFGLFVPLGGLFVIAEEFCNLGGSAETCNPEGTAVDGNAVAAEVVERVVRTMREREVFARVHHLFEVFHSGVNGFLAIGEALHVLRLVVVTVDHEHVFRSEVLPFLHVVPVVGIRFCVEGATEVVDHGATHSTRAFELRIREVGVGEVHKFVVAATVVVHGENGIAKALHHDAIEARHEGEQAKAAVEVNVEGVEERIVGAFANQEAVFLIPHGGFGEETERVDGEALEFGLLGGCLVELCDFLLRHEGFESLEASVEVLVGGESFRKEGDHAAVCFRVECGVLLGGGELVQLDFREVEHEVELEADLLLRLEDCGHGDGASNRFTATVNVLDPGTGNATALEGGLQNALGVVLIEHRLHGNVEVVLLVPSHAHAHATVEVAFGESLFVIKFDTANRATIFEFLVELHTFRETCCRNEHKAGVLNALTVLLGHVTRDGVLDLDNRHFAGFLGVVFERKDGGAHGEAGEAFVTRSHVAGLRLGDGNTLAFVNGFAHRIESGVLHLGGVIARLAEEFAVVCPSGGEGAFAGCFFANHAVEEVDEHGAVEGGNVLAASDQSLGAVAELDVPAFECSLVRCKKRLVGENLVELCFCLLLVLHVGVAEHACAISVEEREVVVVDTECGKVANHEGGLCAENGFLEEEVVEAKIRRLFGADLNARHHVHHGSRASRRCGKRRTNTTHCNTRRRRRGRKRSVPGLDKFHGEARGHQFLNGSGLFCTGEIIFNAHNEIRF